MYDFIFFIMTNKRVFLWDNLKFFAIISIVLFHSTVPIRDGMPFLKYIHPIIHYWAMTLFAFISGYWYKNKTIKEIAIIYLLVELK